MKTSVIYGIGGRQRACLPEEYDGNKHQYRPPQFIAAHDYTYKTPGDSTKRQECKPDSIHLKNVIYRLVRGIPKGFRSAFGGDERQPRVISAEAVADIHELDEAISRLMADRREAIDAAWRRGRPLKKSDCIDG